MAGNYMDAPSDRIAWDRDGSVLTFGLNTGGVVAQPASVRRNINSESEASVSLEYVWSVAVVFPIPMYCSAVFIATVEPTGVWKIETSKDTTNGLDGVWNTQYLEEQNLSKFVKPRYRDYSNLSILQTNSSSSDLRGIRMTRSRITSSEALRAFHVYGTPASTATKDRLALWHPTNDVKLTPQYFDWGNVPRSTSASRPFRIKNLSATRTATDIDVYVESLTPGTPSVADMHTMSGDGGATFLSGLNLDEIAPGAISRQLILKRTVPANAQVSVWSARLAADVNLWKG